MKLSHQHPQQPPVSIARALVGQEPPVNTQFVLEKVDDMKLDILLKLDDIVITMKTMRWLCRPASGGLMNTVQLRMFPVLRAFVWNRSTLSLCWLLGSWLGSLVSCRLNRTSRVLPWGNLITWAQCSGLAAVWTWAQLTLFFFASNDNRLPSHSEYSHWQGLVPMEMWNRPGSCFFLFFLPAWKGLSCCSSIYSARHKELFSFLVFHSLSNV